MNEIGFASAFRQELKAISSCDADGNLVPEKEIEFDKAFSEWLIRLSFTAESNREFFDNLFFLKEEDLINPSGMLAELQNAETSNPAFLGLRKEWALRGDGASRDSEAEGSPPDIASATPSKAYSLTVGAKGSWRSTIQGALLRKSISPESVKLLITELNAVLTRPVDEFPESLQTQLGIDECHKVLLENATLRLPPIARHRLLLEVAFPDYIARVWDTPRIPMAVLYKWVHARPVNALCLSGGGIRSATFGLGILQGLARGGGLDQFQYLSTVSGGGYIGGWLSTWSCHENGFTPVVAKLSKRTQPDDPLRPETSQLTHLRQFSNYLTPKLGFMSADTWTIIATYLRNLLLNWIIFLPALAALLMIPRFCIALLHHQASARLMYGTAVTGITAAVWSIVYAALERPSLNGHSGPGNAVSKACLGRFLCFCLGPLYLSSLCFAALWVWLRAGNQLTGAFFGWYVKDHAPGPWPFLLLGLGIHLLAWIIYTVRLWKSSLPELFACLATGVTAGFLLWRGAKLCYASDLAAPQLEWYAALATPYFLGSFLLSLFLFIGIASRVTEDTDREWWARMSAWNLIVIGAWTLFSCLVIFGPEALLRLPHWFAGIGGITGFVTLVLSHSGLTAANKKEAGESRHIPNSANLALAIAAPLFIATVVAALSLATTWVFSHIDKESAFHGPNRLARSDINDLPYFASQLKDHSLPVPNWIWQQLSIPLQHQLENYKGTDKEDMSLRANLTDELNDLVRDNMVYEPDAFRNVELSPASATALRQTLTGQRREQRNVLLLQDALHRELNASRFDHRMITDQSTWRQVLVIFAVFIFLSWLCSRFININKFSLHAVYRDRLIRAYLGASNPRRRPNCFSGFDPEDNVNMASLKLKPFHVVNMTLNLVGGDNLAWQQRKAESFTATPLHAGNYGLGYRNVEEYASGKTRLPPVLKHQAERNLDRRKEPVVKEAEHRKHAGLPLGTAMAISGAAADANMGYHSSPVLAFIMTLFNIRLGAWLGNPGSPGNKSYTDKAPRGAFGHLVKETLGLTDNKEPYVYLSDGGHFENLGLYEMVLRRCRLIVVSDAGADPKCALEDLGNAIRKIRIDLGIQIVVDKFSIASRRHSESKYCAIGDIRYSDVDGDGVTPGKLIYIKPSIAGGEPLDVYNYKEESCNFPHESTADQWFSESQFESYRALGLHIIERMSKGANSQENDAKTSSPGDPLAGFVAKASEYLAALPSDLPDFSRRVLTPVIVVGKAAFPNDPDHEQGENS